MDVAGLRHAFGHPGATPTWQTAQKQGVGTARGSRSRVWFTLARGIVTEVYYPRVDVANVRDLQFLVSDGHTFVHEEQRDLLATVTAADGAIPAYQIVSGDREGRYRLTKRIVADPEADALVLRAAFEPLRAPAQRYALYLLCNPQVKNRGWNNTARVLTVDGRSVLVAWREDVALALVTSAPAAKASCGFVGFSEGWQDLHQNYQMDWEFDAADDGNVALTAQLSASDGGTASARPSSWSRDRSAAGGLTFTVVMGFASSAEDAVATALGTMAKPFAEIEAAYIDG